MAGLPVMFGFVAKEALYLGLSDAGANAAVAAAVIGNAMMFAVGFTVALRPFLGPAVQTPKQAHEGPFELWAGPVILGGAGLLAGLATALTADILVAPAASAALGQAARPDLHLVPPYVSTPLVLSLVTVAIGIVLFLSAARIRAALVRLLQAIGWGPDRGFDQAVAGLVGLAGAVTAILQHGHLRGYVKLTVLVTAVALLVPLVAFDELPAAVAVPPLTLYEWAILALGVFGLIAVLAARTRLTAIVSLGIQGFAVAVLFLLFGAPDLSFTQFMVETLSVVILALVMTRLSLAERDHRPRGEILVDGGIALAAGLGFALTLLAVVQVPFDRRLTEFYESYSRVIAHGRNIVNVIIVDFRGLDTLGEIAVVMIAGLCILALVRVKARRRIPAEPAGGGR
jgi:multicomponent Na+:H+ antiporter subunit A